MADKAVVEVEFSDDGGTHMLVKYTGDDPLGDDSQAMLQANIMVALFQTELEKRGPDALVDYVEENRDIWARDMEVRDSEGGPKGEPIW